MLLVLLSSFRWSSKKTCGFSGYKIYTYITILNNLHVCFLIKFALFIVLRMGFSRNRILRPAFSQGTEEEGHPIGIDQLSSLETRRFSFGQAVASEAKRNQSSHTCDVEKEKKEKKGQKRTLIHQHCLKYKTLNGFFSLVLEKGKKRCVRSPRENKSNR